ncbi:methyl-accepting chemotaxis protein II, partial [Salmonella enterica]|nr:methyl-accepting chemotaxis protein II [Salmonella enterica]
MPDGVAPFGNIHRYASTNGESASSPSAPSPCILRRHRRCDTVIVNIVFRNNVFPFCKSKVITAGADNVDNSLSGRCLMFNRIRVVT